MPLLTPRQADIIALARDTGRLDVDSLTTHFGVTPQTIRKDLNQLCEQGLLQRYHGGAMLPSGSPTSPTRRAGSSRPTPSAGSASGPPA